MFSLVVDDAQTPEIIEAVIRANQTGEFGDGRIFIRKLESTFRISESCSAEPAQRAELPS